MPADTTQPGVADGTGIERRHVPQYVRPLIRDGLVTERKAWVPGRRQRVKTYLLTEAGRREASLLRRRVLTWTVEAEGEDGGKGSQRLSELAQGRYRGVPLLKVLRAAEFAGFLPASPQSLMNGSPGRQRTDRAVRGRPTENGLSPGAPGGPAIPGGSSTAFGPVEMLGDSPTIRRFAGRTKELGWLTSTDDEARMLIVEGVAGIGKSWLAAEACVRLRGTKNLFWHHVRPWDNRQSILLHLAEFLDAAGKPNLRAAIVRNHLERAPGILADDLPGTRSFLVFDDAHQASDETRQVFRILLDAMAHATDVQAVILTRRRLSFYDRREVTLGGQVREIRLDGLEIPEVLASLAMSAEPWTPLPIPVESLRHPLLLDLCRANRSLPSRARADVRQFLEETLLVELSGTQRKMMGLASLYEVPVPSEALFQRPAWDAEILLALTDRELLRTVAEDRYEIHDTIRDFFVQRLAPHERRAYATFAIRQLRRLADNAMTSRRFRSCADYLSNAIRLCDSPCERAILQEALGDAQTRTGDLLALSVAYRSGITEAQSAKERRRLHRKLAMAFAEHGALKAAAVEVEAGRSIRGSADRVEEGWFELICARIANRRDQYREAAAHARRALSTFRKARFGEGVARASLELAYALSIPGTTDARGKPMADRHYEDALHLAPSLNDPAFTIRVHMELAGLRGQVSGDEKAVMEHLSAVESTPGAKEDPFVRQQVLGLRGWARMVLLADFPGAEADVREAIRLAEALQDPVAAAEEKITLAGAVRGQGRLDESAALWNEVTAEMLRLGFNRDRCLSLLVYLGEYHLIRADRAAWTRLLQSVKALGITRLVQYPHGAVLEAFDRLLKGDFANVTALFDQALHALRRSTTKHGLYAPMMESGIEFWYAVALAAMGRTEDAAAHRERAMEAFRERHYQSRVIMGPVRERQLLKGIGQLMKARRPVEGPA
jgi:tetratricopeptide (TPR) repeat protein